jgi:hypothetical protein
MSNHVKACPTMMVVGLFCFLTSKYNVEITKLYSCMLLTIPEVSKHNIVILNTFIEDVS